MELYYPLVLDGATGTELQKRGYDGSVSAEAWVLEHPEVIHDLDDAYIKAGSDIVYSPTFGANPIKLEENGIFNQTADFNRRLVETAKEGISGRCLIAGDISPTGKFLAPLGDLAFEELVDLYTEQAKGLEAAGVDLYVIETIMTVPEARAALLAVRSVSDKPVLVSFTTDANGKTLTGTDATAALVIMQGMGVDAFGLNCSVGPDDMLTQIRRLREYATVPLAAKPNAGLPIVEDGKIVYKLTAEELAGFVPAFAEAGVMLFGGCCGTTPEHVKAIREALEGVPMVKPAPAAHLAGKVVCATEKQVFVLDPGIRVSEVLTCDAGLEDRIDEAMDGAAPVIAIEIKSRDDLDEFGACQYAINKPLCLVCEDADLLERALRLYQGRALYAGGLPDEALAPLARKYGLIY
ncbi:MAG: homocysteine S-methyltransferase family protein [Mogibacterium sp.]|nr:homocysteine S-methyltransferase family protein [Mogibacterium sp.]